MLFFKFTTADGSPVPNPFVEESAFVTLLYAIIELVIVPIPLLKKTPPPSIYAYVART